MSAGSTPTAAVADDLEGVSEIRPGNYAFFDAFQAGIGSCSLDDAAFRALFTASPVKRAGRDRFVRNVLIAIGNSGEIALADQAENLLCDASPLVRAMAVWALSRLVDNKAFSALRNAYGKDEEDPAVRAEWGSG